MTTSYDDDNSFDDGEEFLDGNDEEHVAMLETEGGQRGSRIKRIGINGTVKNPFSSSAKSTGWWLCRGRHPHILFPTVLVSVILLVIIASSGRLSNNSGETAADEIGLPSTMKDDTNTVVEDSAGGSRTRTPPPPHQQQQNTNEKEQHSQEGLAAPSSPNSGSSSAGGGTDTASNNKSNVGSSRNNVEDMRKGFLAKKKELYTRLQTEYGPRTFKNMFLLPNDDDDEGTTAINNIVNRESRGRSFIQSLNKENDLGWKRMKRKVTIKLLKAINDDNEVQQSNRQLPGEDDEDASSLIPFVWATGGHSAAAGHGNFFNQSYTAVMEQSLQPLFESVGVQFVGRNYAVGGHRSGPEVGMCTESMFGTDFDVLSWDYGMTDGNDPQLAELYFYRAGMSPNNPAAILINDKNKERKKVMSSLEERGMTALYQVKEEQLAVQKLIPDSAGRSDEEIKAMPPFVRNFRCGRSIETGDPYCGEEKFNNQICEKRRFKTSWHPGWKAHAMVGNLLALFMTEVLGDSLKDIPSKKANQAAKLKELLSQETADHQRFLQSGLPDNSKAWDAPESHQDEIRRMFYKDRNLCHLALLPAQIRYKGILTESQPVSMFDLPDGLLSSRVKQTPNDGDQIRLVGDSATRQECQVPLNQDHQDYFYISEEEGEKELTIPNSKEIQEYRPDGAPFKGLLMICYIGCPWNKCPDGNLFGDEIIKDKSVQVTVNGKSATSLFHVFKECYFLQNEDGDFWEASSNGRYTIRVRLLEPKSYLRLSSILIW